MDDPARFASLDGYLMPARMAPYLRSCNGDEECARRLYVWNIEASAAFWGPISVVEIAARNSMHCVLTEHFQRSDWWHAPGADTQIAEDARNTEHTLREQRRRSSKPATCAVALVTADDVVAALSLGFWSSVLHAPRHRFEQHRYWHQFLYRAFPGWYHKPNDSQTRKAFTRRIELLRKFRNRVAHHEPIHARQLEQDHRLILDIAGFIHPDIATFIHGHSRVSDVLSRRNDAVDRGSCQF